MTKATLFFSHALLPDGWAENVEIGVGDDGRIDSVSANQPGRATDGAIVVPGVANLHSHAFQRAMAGLAEWRGSATEDSFWTWRDVMYRFLERLGPDDVQAIASQLYVEMLEAGFTAVGEFHYLHHQPDGSPYDDIAEMAGQIATAAGKTGIGLTLLPVYYEFGGFGAQPVSGSQCRFANDPDRFHKLRDRCEEISANDGRTVVGFAPHSIRAVTPRSLNEVLSRNPGGPIHVHAAEQVREVEECKAALGAPPVSWLLENLAIDEHWCIIHATHMSDGETDQLAQSGATAGLCPITEANLGDGIFNGTRFHKARGRFGIGSDSHIRIDLAEELRMLEYSQRLRDRGRNLLAENRSANGRALFDAVSIGGAQAIGQPMGQIAPGCHCDLVSLRPDHPVLAGKSGDDWLNGWIFSGDKGCVSAVWVGCRQVVKDGAHHARHTVQTDFTHTMERLLD